MASPSGRMGCTTGASDWLRLWGAAGTGFERKAAVGWAMSELTDRDPEVWLAGFGVSSLMLFSCVGPTLQTGALFFSPDSFGVPALLIVDFFAAFGLMLLGDLSWGLCGAGFGEAGFLFGSDEFAAGFLLFVRRGGDGVGLGAGVAGAVAAGEVGVVRRCSSGRGSCRCGRRRRWRSARACRGR